MNELLTARDNHDIDAPLLEADDDMKVSTRDTQDWILGLAIFAILPAVFWTVIVVAISPALFGVSLDVTVIATIGFGIAAFLAPLYGAFAVGE